MPSAPRPAVQHFIYPLSEGSGYIFGRGRPATLANFRREALGGGTSDWGLSNGYRLAEPGDWVWVYFASGERQICGVGTILTPPEWRSDWGRYSIRIKWNKQMTAALKRAPILYSDYEQHVQGAVVRANARTQRVLSRWLKIEGPANFRQGQEVKFAKMLVDKRRGQPAFRADVMRAFKGTCAISGCSESAALEAAHVVPVASRGGHAVENALLLRADLHNLFDDGSLTVRSNLTVAVAAEVTDRSYRRLEGVPLRMPEGANLHAFRRSLAAHRRLHT